MASNDKKVIVSMTIEEIALNGEHPPREARVYVQGTCVTVIAQQAMERAVAQVKGKKGKK